jgi:hypothetical protein
VRLATREVRVETSTCCNYRCVMCARDALTRAQTTMPNALFERIVQRVRAEQPQVELCTVSGFGELATDGEWRDKLRLARASFPAVHVVTNLSLIEGADLELLATLATEVRVSLYADDEESFQRIHRPRGHVTQAEIAARIEALSAWRSRGLVLSVTCCALDENAASIERWIERWEGRVDHLEVWRPHNWIHARRYREVAAPRLPSCGRPASGPIQVQVDGTLNVCCFDFDGEMVIGDLGRQSLAEIYDGAPLRRIRELHAEGRADELPLCAICDQRDPPEVRQGYLLHCSGSEPEERILRTSSGREVLPVRRSGADQ